MYANKFVVYAKFLEGVQSFLRQHNLLLLYFVYLFRLFSLFFERAKNTRANISEFIHRVYGDSKSFLEAAIWSSAILY